MNLVQQTIPTTEEEVRLKSTIGELIEASKTAVILSHVDLSHATDLCKAIKQRRDEAEKARTAITAPINQGLKEINSRFKAMTEPLVQAESALKSKMIQFQEAEERRARAEAERKERERQEQLRKEQEEAERRRLAEEAEACDPTLDRPAMPPAETATAPVTPLAPIQPAIRKTTYGQSGASFTAKKVWDYELADLSQVPVHFLCLNETKVNQAIKAGIRDIPGIRVFEKTVAQVR